MSPQNFPIQNSHSRYPQQPIASPNATSSLSNTYAYISPLPHPVLDNSSNLLLYLPSLSTGARCLLPHPSLSSS